jgi:hypothetical protein
LLYVRVSTTVALIKMPFSPLSQTRCLALRRTQSTVLVTILAWCLFHPLGLRAQSNVLTYHNDNGRTGQYLGETNLTLANVDTNTFGLLFSQQVDGQIYGQPLYVAGVTIGNKGMHNVVFVATENDSVYAFDADNDTGSNSAPLWMTNFLNPTAGVTTVPNADVGSANIAPVIGITSTPVIDPVTQTIFIEAKTKEVSGTTTSYVHRLHALSLSSGAEKFGGPVVISPIVNGTGDGNNDDGQIPFDGLRQLNRPGLLELNGVIYIAYASHGDQTPYHGWILGYNATNLQPQGIYISTPNSGLGGFWEAGGGPGADSNGVIYAVSGNGGFDGPTNNDYGDSFIKIVVSGTNLIQTDYFTPYDQQNLANSDLDLGSGGHIILPDEVGSTAHPHLMIGGGKEGTLYLVDRDNMGHFNPVNNSQVVQAVSNLSASFATPAYFNGMLYYAGNGGALESFTLTNGALGTTPTATGPETYGSPGATPSISANGTSNAIVWTLQNGSPAVLRAYNATNVAIELYNSSQAGTRDTLGASDKFTEATVANGKVYVPLAAAVSVFGLGLWSSPPAISPNGAIFTNSVMVTLSSGMTGAQIYYTTDGTLPTTNSTLYNAPFTLTNTTVVHAILSAANESPGGPVGALFILAPTNAALNGFGANWTYNGGAVETNNGVELTDGNGGEARSAFYNFPISVAAFNAQFVYQGVGLADGTAFVMQNSSSGPSALGGSGGALGYSGIGPGAAVEFNLYSGQGGSGTIFATDGVTGGYYSTLPLNLDLGNPVWITINYEGGLLTEEMEDLVTGATYGTNYAVDLASDVGDTNVAYVGFTGGTGGEESVQTVSDFIFTELAQYGAPPTITPNGGIFTNLIQVALSTTQSNAQIYYTLNGALPTTNSTLYTAPLTLSRTAAVKAIAVSGNSVSAPAFAFFQVIPVGTSISGFGTNGTGWTLNGGATLANNILELTDGNDSEARSAFYDAPQLITNFIAQFVYQSTGGADGTCFVVQNDPSGPSSLGSSGGDLGYAGITPSAAVEFNLYSGQGGTGTRFATDGATTGYASTLPLNLGSGDLIAVSLSYNGSILTENLVDENNGNSYAASYSANLSSIVGSNTAWVGFTGGDGGVSSVQTVTDFTFSPIFPPPMLTAVFSKPQLALSWSTTPIGYVVESTTNLADPASWTQISQAPTVSGGLEQLIIVPGTTNTYYRLRLP